MPSSPPSPRDPDREQHMTDRLFAALRPRALDEVAEEAYGRRRAGDLARAFDAPHTPSGRSARARGRSRRPSLILAGTAAAGLAAAVVLVPGLVSDDASPGRAPIQAGSPSTPPVASATPLDARSVLLAAAETAAREPADSGRYWYTRTRTDSLIRDLPGAYEARLDELLRQREAAKGDAGGDDAAEKAAEKEFEREVGRLKRESARSAGPPFAAATSETSETWRARDKGGTNRGVTRPAPEATFASAADEARWKAMGSPELVPDRRTRTYEDDLDRVLSIDNPGLTIRNVSKLPTRKEALRGRLRDMYEASPGRRGQADAGFAAYLWQTGTDLLTSPITPGTRAALFRVLAEQPGITSTGRAGDVFGREGVALSTTTPGDETTRGDVEYRMILDEGTAELLQIEVRDERPLPLLSQAFERTGWVDRLGERPAG
ncbi:CU044_5270 family protein [Sphaerisporangium sp. TRM90804]|uniref:CU044_5270 family protein n=1 Tax=Sphaerisporangium sp. TRM90804 TaxID=3031113 RepID=UPI0024486EC0|nr:CU044_5270 family protein [Sphaerisporangium sp. TRM90804]MDH2429394.1 CU044_5270 family protein [Sphaerisporangium sp. TRM90804]